MSTGVLLLTDIKTDFMSKPLFHRYHGLGNDYLVCEQNVFEQFTAQQIIRICDRNLGIGSDGILVNIASDDGIVLRIINPDGSEAEKSGNGLRIFARYLFDQGKVADSPFQVTTLGGVVSCQVFEHGHLIVVDMGTANFSPAALPALVADDVSLSLPINIKDAQFTATLVSMGNPHCVIKLDDLVITPELVKEYGKEIETLALFPKRTNVQFVKVIDRENIEIGIWERGAGYTLASGSSSCAAASAMKKLGFVDNNISVHMPGGKLDIYIDDAYQVRMRGPVQKIAEVLLEADCFFDLM